MPFKNTLITQHSNAQALLSAAKAAEQKVKLSYPTAGRKVEEEAFRQVTNYASGVVYYLRQQVQK